MIAAGPLQRAGIPAAADEARGAAAEVSLRTVGVGLSVGALLAVTNLYAGLRSGVWETGAVFASVLSFLLLRLAAGASPSRRNPREDNFSQTLAVAAGGMPAAAGLLGAIPALALHGRAPGGWAIGLLAVLLGALGVGLAVLTRRAWVVEQEVPFPTGRSTAEVIASLHADPTRRAATTRPLALGAALSAGLGLLRLASPRWFPEASHPSWRVGPSSFSELTLGIAWSPMLAGGGMLIGLPAAASALAGGWVARGLVAPRLVSLGLVPDGGYGSITALVLWPATGLLLGATLRGVLSPLVRPAVRRAWCHLVPRSPTVPVVAALTLLPAVFGVLILGVGMSAWQALVALAISVPLALSCARSSGETDVTPLGPTAQLGQATLGVAAPGTSAQNIAGGMVVAGVATQLSLSLSSFKAGRLLGASVRLQVLAQLAGVVWGAAIALPAYVLLVGARGLGTEALPVPGAAQWTILSEVMSGVPAWTFGTWGALGLGTIAGALLSAWSSLRPSAWIPSPVALGIGLLLPASYAVILFLGAVCGHLVSRRRADAAPAVGAGLIAGEALIAVGAAALSALGLSLG